MLIYFVRHGHPDYENDCLTALGKKHAAAAAARLADAGIERIYASTHGRATETARYTAERLGLEIIPCEFMREISSAPLTDEPYPENGTPWRIASRWSAAGISLTDPNWRTREPFCKNMAVASVDRVICGLDKFLGELGYQREGDYYRVTKADDCQTVAIFSHGGSSSAAMSHLLNIPFLQFCGCFHLDFTSVSVISMSNELGALICPRVMLVNDRAHIEGLTVDA